MLNFKWLMFPGLGMTCGTVSLLKNTLDAYNNRGPRAIDLIVNTMTIGFITTFPPLLFLSALYILEKRKKFSKN